jgi:hypothetical protein
MKEYIYSKDGNSRAVIWPDEGTRNPRYEETNVATFETWDIVSPSPDYGAVRNLRQKLVWTLSNANGYGWMDKRGREHKANDNYTVGLMMRTLRAMGGALYVVPLFKNSQGELVVGTLPQTTTPMQSEIPVGIAYVSPEHSDLDYDQQDLAFVVQQELDTYNTWAAGDIWRYEIQSLVDCPCGGAHPGCTGSQWNVEYEATGIYKTESAVAHAAQSWAELEKVA